MVGIVVVGAAVGGGVGAAMNNKKSATLPNVSVLEFEKSFNDVLTFIQ